MIGWLRFGGGDNEPKSIGKIILETRKYKRMALFNTLALAISLLLIYLIKIYPVFLPNDFSNPAVVNFISSELFRGETSQFFSYLNRYNEQEEGIHLPPPSEYYAVDPT